MKQWSKWAASIVCGGLFVWVLQPADPAVKITFEAAEGTVYATLFVCGGTNPLSDVTEFESRFSGQHMAIVVVGLCSLPVQHAKLFRLDHIEPATNVGHPRYEQLHAKFLMWKLPYERVVYYDLDVVVKQPVNRCADLCPQHHELCAVTDSIAMKLLGRKPDDLYFNTGALVLTPNMKTFRQLTAAGTDNNRWADQDTLNRLFKHRWHELPKICNWQADDRFAQKELNNESIWVVHAHRFL